MKKTTAQIMVRRINKRDGEGTARLYENYSGRGMFGEQTCGVVAPAWAFPKNCKYRRDSMGRYMIVY